MSDNLDKLNKTLKKRAELAKQNQIRFVECISVDWKNKTMDALGNEDGSEYLDVILGFGYADIKPVVGTTCLIGIVDGQEVMTFLINAEDVELVETKAENIVFNDGKNNGLVKVKELTAKLNALENDLNTLKTVFKNWIPVSQDGGASLKSVINGWTSRSFSETKQTEIENNKITH